MVGSPVQWTKHEEELAQAFDESMNAEDYEQALSFVKELIKLRKHNPVYYLWLGDCYRLLAQVDNALDSYRKALDLDGKYYTVGDDFRDDAKRYINGLELIQKSTQAFQVKKYEEAIHWIDDFIKIDPNWGDMYALRGYCNDLLGNRVLAIKDYSLSLNRKLSEHLRLQIESNIKPTELKSLSLITDKVEWDSGNSGANFVEEYVKLLKSIEELLPIFPDIADSPKFSRFCKDIDELRKVSMRTPGKAILIGLDEDGIFVVTKEELSRKRRKHPNRQYLYSSRVEDMEQSEEAIISLNLGQRLAVKDIPKTESNLKELERKRRYYWKHKAKLSAKQNEYDEKHKAQIHFKNKFYYMLSKYGISKTYMMKDVKNKSTEDSVYHQLSNE